jgi:hypothetical protein
MFMSGAPAHAQATGGIHRGGVGCGVHISLGGDPFDAKVADPLEPQFSVGVRYGDFPFARTVVGAANFGGNFGLIQLPCAFDNGGMQLSLEGGVFTQFDMRTRGNDLITEDYVIGLPISFRYHRWSGKLRAYHRSSHLGDEYWQRNPNETRFDLTYEAINLVMARELGTSRVYAGWDHSYKRRGTQVKPGIAQAGIDFRTKRPTVAFGHLVRGRWRGGVDLQSFRDLDWKTVVSSKIGVQLENREDLPGHTIALYLEYYTGVSPAGQFYGKKVSSVGLTAVLTF